MQGASPLASPGLRGRGTGSTCHPCPRRGGFASCEAGLRWRSDTRRGALPSLPPANHAFSFVLAPYPPTRARRALFPGGEGGDFRLFYARGFAPCIPGAEGTRHWLDLPSLSPAGGQNHSQGTLFVGFAETYRLSRRGAGGEAPGKIKKKGLPLPRRGRGSGGWGQKSKLKSGLAGDKKGKPPAGHCQRPPSRQRREHAPARVPQRQGQPVPQAA